MNDDPVMFIRAFLEAEYQVYLTHATEPDNTVFQARVEEYLNFFAFKVSRSEVFLFRPATIDTDWFEENQDRAEEIEPRKLFLIRTYQHPEFGVIHRCYVGDEYEGNCDYAACFCIGEHANEVKIISRHLMNWVHTGWDWTGGKRMKDFGQLINVLRFQVPEHAKDLADYESETGTI